jgi:hypothetical protein
MRLPFAVFTRLLHWLSSEWHHSDLNDGNQILKTLEVLAVTGDKRKVFGKGSRCDEQVCEATPRLAALLDYGRVHSAIRSSRSNVEWQRVKGGLSLLQAILPSGALRPVSCR